MKKPKMLNSVSLVQATIYDFISFIKYIAVTGVFNLQFSYVSVLPISTVINISVFLTQDGSRSLESFRVYANVCRPLGDFMVVDAPSS